LARRKGDPRDRRGHESDRLRESINKLRRAGLSNSDIQKLLNRTAYRALKG
jgi:5-enolpyruvylshikimate-3-phosphate synthase